MEGYASDIVDIATGLNLKDIILVGHSVSAVIGLISAEMAPELFTNVIMVSPSPCYINQDDYIGGFSSAEIEELLESLNNNHLGWSIAMAPVIMGNPERSELGEELANSFCKTDPDIAKHFAKATFLTDKRNMLKDVKVPTLIMQCKSDVIAPIEVGEYMHLNIAGSKLVVMDATGHCPNLSAPQETISVIKDYLSNE